MVKSQMSKTPLVDSLGVKPIPHFEGYFATEGGDIYSLKRGGKFLRQRISIHGYKRVNVVQNGNKRQVAAHRLTALAFGIIDHQEIVNHIDGNKTNNHISNLEKSDPKHNYHHAVRTGLLVVAKGENANSKLTTQEVLEIRSLYKRNKDRSSNILELSRKYSISQRMIREIISRRSWKHI